jgi:hypothetical protein
MNENGRSEELEMNIPTEKLIRYNNFIGICMRMLICPFYCSFVSALVFQANEFRPNDLSEAMSESGARPDSRTESADDPSVLRERNTLFGV